MRSDFDDSPRPWIQRAAQWMTPEAGDLLVLVTAVLAAALIAVLAFMVAL